GSPQRMRLGRSGGSQCYQRGASDGSPSPDTHSRRKAYRPGSCENRNGSSAEFTVSKIHRALIGTSGGSSGPLIRGVETRALREIRDRIVENDLSDQILAVPTAAHLEDELGYCQWVAVAPVASGIDQHPLWSVDLDHIGCARRCAFRDGIKGH